MLPTAVVDCVQTVNNLVALWDSELTMANHVASVSCLSFFQLRQLRLVKKSLTPDAMQTLVQAFVSSRLDYCNSILSGVSGQLLEQPKRAKNAASRLGNWSTMV